MNDLLSIIICTHNKCAYLDLTLYTLALFNIRAEIIIVDDGSEDDTLSIISNYEKTLNIKYVFQCNQGLSAARNTGIRYAKGKYLLFMDDDRLILDNYINSMHLSDNNIIIGIRRELYVADIYNNLHNVKNEIEESPEKIHKKSHFERYFRKVNLIYEEDNIVIPWVGCTFSNTIVPAWCFQYVGGFDENFKGWGFEDLEFAYRLWTNEKTQSLIFRVDNKLINYHLFHLHSKNINEQRHINYKYFCKKHPDFAILLYDYFNKNIINIQEYNQILLNLKANSD